MMSDFDALCDRVANVSMYNNIVHEMFNDGVINGGRLYVLYLFSVNVMRKRPSILAHSVIAMMLTIKRCI